MSNGKIFCHHCGTELPDTANFCFNCGTKQVHVPPSTGESLMIDFDGDIVQQLNRYFFEALKKRVQEEHNAEQFQIYSERLYESGFRDIVDRRANQLAEYLYSPEAKEKGNRRINAEIVVTFDELLDYFIIRYCQDLNEITLPEAILKYQDLSIDQIDLFEMIPDYLNFDQEDEKVFTDFLKMPLDKLKNASQSFLFPQKNEKILFICDQSLLGSCKEGFAMTEKALYWRAHLEKARSVHYNQLEKIEKTKDWININDHFFNVSPSLNLKMMKLLKKLKSGYRLQG